MKGKIIVLALFSFIIYILLCAVFFFATPFMVSWGEAKPWYLQAIIFAQDFPFNLIRSNGEIKMSLIFINALFWSSSLIGMFWMLFVKSKR